MHDQLKFFECEHIVRDLSIKPIKCRESMALSSDSKEF